MNKLFLQASRRSTLGRPPSCHPPDHAGVLPQLILKAINMLAYLDQDNMKLIPASESEYVLA